MIFYAFHFCTFEKDQVTIIYILQRELREEDKRYRAYLEQLKREEKERELELERLCDMEVIQIRCVIMVIMLFAPNNKDRIWNRTSHLIYLEPVDDKFDV